jgi:hypothetical protein
MHKHHYALVCVCKEHCYAKRIPNYVGISLGTQSSVASNRVLLTKYEINNNRQGVIKGDR